MNLCAYARVSSEGQRDNTSLQTQREAMIEYCERFHHTMVGYYEDVESAASMDQREGFKWAMRTVQAVDGLLVYRLDRMTRSVIDGERLKVELAKQGKALLAVCETVDLESESGSFMYTISTAVAELERKRLLKRAYAGRQAKKAVGGYIGGQPPYGFVCHKGTLLEHPFEQSMILKIKEMYAEGYSYAGIARWLNENNIASKHRKGWRYLTVKRVLDGEPTIVKQLRESGKLLDAHYWSEINGVTRQTSKLDTTRDEASTG